MSKKKGSGDKTYENRTIAIFFENEKFGEGAFLSMRVTEDTLAQFEKVEPGSRLVFKPGFRKDGSPVEAAEGGHIHYLEFLPPLGPSTNSSKDKEEEASSDL